MSDVRATGGQRAVAWTKDDPVGAEFTEVDLQPGRLVASGTAIGSEPLPYRLDYGLDTAAGYVTRRMWVAARGDGWSRTLELHRTTSGRWTAATTAEGRAALPPPGELLARPDGLAALDGALDVDLALSPFTNTMPVLRHGLLAATDPVDFVMAWISVPDLSVHRSAQRYSFRRPLDDGHSLVRYESLDGDGFVADIVFEAAGLVVDYPEIARRIK